MWTYIIRRLLLMVPTVFGITVVTFLVMQLSPGDPLQIQMGSGGTGTTSITREQFRIQRRQFNLDKPVLLNFRYFMNYEPQMRLCSEFRGLSEDEIAKEIEALYQKRDSKDPAIREKLRFISRLGIDSFEKRFNDPSARSSLAKPVANGVELEASEMGIQGVPPLVEILKNSKDLNKKIGAIRCLKDIEDEPFAYTYTRYPSEKESPKILATWSIWWKRNSTKFGPIPTPRLQELSSKFADMLKMTRMDLLSSVMDLQPEDAPFFAAKLNEKAGLNEKVVASLAMNTTVRKWLSRNKMEEKPMKVDVAVGESETAVSEVAENWILAYDAAQDVYEPGFFKKVLYIFTQTQYAHFAWNLITFDFGQSMIGTREPVTAKIWHAVKYSAPLIFMAQGFIYLVAIPLGIVCAVRRGRTTDRVISSSLFMLYSIPAFVAAMLFLVFFCYGKPFSIFPFDGLHSDGADEMSFFPWLLDYLWHAILPVICMSVFSLAGMAMYARTSMLEIINQDYIRTARAKGVAEKWVILKHALRNALIPVITLFAHFIPALLGGSVLIEVLFNIPGMGRLSFQTIQEKDITTLMALIYIDAIIVLLCVLLSDLLYMVVDPRISFSKAETS